MKTIRNKALNFIEKQWNIIDVDNFEYIVKKSFNDIILNKIPSLNPKIIRLAGQSGSGKTTRLLPIIKEKVSNNFVEISVRYFAKEHPLYNTFSSDIVREKTNGFALLLLFRVVELLIKHKYNILFEVTILDPNFEIYLNTLAKENNYTLNFHILSIPLFLSNEWILKRQKETGRIVAKTSADYFYNILPISLKEISGINLSFDDKFYLWNSVGKEPIYECNIKGFDILMEKFEYYRNIKQRV